MYIFRFLFVLNVIDYTKESQQLVHSWFSNIQRTTYCCQSLQTSVSSRSHSLCEFSPVSVPLEGIWVKAVLCTHNFYEGEICVERISRKLSLLNIWQNSYPVFFIVLCLRSFKIARKKNYFYSSCCLCLSVVIWPALIADWKKLHVVHHRLACLTMCRAECRFCGGDSLRGMLCVEYILLCWLLMGSPETGITTC